jgi:hypothetical protein
VPPSVATAQEYSESSSDSDDLRGESKEEQERKAADAALARAEKRAQKKAKRKEEEATKLVTKQLTLEVMRRLKRPVKRAVPKLGAGLALLKARVWSSRPRLEKDNKTFPQAAWGAMTHSENAYREEEEKDEIETMFSNETRSHVSDVSASEAEIDYVD